MRANKRPECYSSVTDGLPIRHHIKSQYHKEMVKRGSSLFIGNTSLGLFIYRVRSSKLFGPVSPASAPEELGPCRTSVTLGLALLPRTTMSDHQEQEDTDSYIMDGEEGAALEAAFSDAASMAASDTPPPSVTPKAAEEEIKALSRKESRAIRWWRIAVLMSLLVTAAAISTATYLVLQEENYEAFESNVREGHETIACIVAQSYSLALLVSLVRCLHYRCLGASNGEHLRRDKRCGPHSGGHGGLARPTLSLRDTRSL